MTGPNFRFFLLCSICLCGCNSPEEVTFPSTPQAFPKEVETALNNSTEFELYSLDPLDYDIDNRKRTDDPGRLYGWKVLGRVQLDDAKQRRDIIDAFRAATAETDDEAVACFDPRHAIRVEHDGQPMDLLICFACSSVYIRLNHEEHAYLDVTNGGIAEPVFDRILKAHDVRLAKKPLH